MLETKMHPTISVSELDMPLVYLKHCKLFIKCKTKEQLGESQKAKQGSGMPWNHVTTLLRRPLALKSLRGNSEDLGQAASSDRPKRLL